MLDLKILIANNGTLLPEKKLFYSNSITISIFPMLLIISIPQEFQQDFLSMHLQLLPPKFLMMFYIVQIVSAFLENI